MKSVDVFHDACSPSVAPFVGAWIEIDLPGTLPLQVPVAPFVGAWIEMSLRLPIFSYATVAPFVGAWIEIWIHLN